MKKVDSSPPAKDLTGWVRSALAHLYDTAYLQKHPLAFMLEIGHDTDRITRAQKVRRLLLQSIEALQTSQMSDFFEKSDICEVSPHATRAYAILTYRYVSGLSIQEVAAELGLSERQTYREHEKGLEAVAGLLWDVICTSSQGNEPAANAATRESTAEGPADEIQLAQMEAGRLRQSVHLESLSLRDTLEDVVITLAPVTAQAGIQISLPAPAIWPLIIADRVMLRQALLNLLRYALDSAGNDLAITVSQAEGALIVDIVGSDTAASPSHKPPEHGPAASVPQSERAASDVSIAVAEALIDAQDAKLAINRQAGLWHAGLTLRISNKTRIVLVIDDNVDLVGLFKRYLGGHDISIISAQDGEQAIRMATKLQPGLITLDVMMPQQDGWEVLRELRRMPDLAKTPIVVCSVLREAQLAQAMGASDYITKPFTQVELLQVVQRWLGPLPPAS